jgi:GT2 family glycosyltransferase
MYSEELDWCHRIKKQGWQIVFNPQAVVIHHEGKSSEQVVAQRHIYFQSSKIRYTALYHGKVIAHLLMHWLKIQYRTQLIMERVKWLVGHKRELRKQRIQAYKQVLQSRFRS